MSLGTLGGLPLDVRRLLYGLAAIHLSRISRRVREESRRDYLEQCTSVPISGKELRRYVRLRVVEMAGSTGLEMVLVVPVGSVRGATRLQISQSSDEDTLEYPKGRGEVALDWLSSIRIYRRRGVERYVRGYAPLTCSRVLRRQLDRVLGGLYCTLEDLVGCRLVPGTLTVDRERPLSEEERVGAERRVLSHFRVEYSWLVRETWGLVVSSPALIARVKARDEVQRRIRVALETGQAMPPEGVYLAYRSMEDVTRVLEALDTVRVLCMASYQSIRFTVLGSGRGWVYCVQDTLSYAWKALSERVGEGEEDRGTRFWHAYAGTRHLVVEAD
jgi:hypothetical protein